MRVQIQPTTDADLAVTTKGAVWCQYFSAMKRYIDDDPTADKACAEGLEVARKKSKLVIHSRLNLAQLSPTVRLD